MRSLLARLVILASLASLLSCLAAPSEAAFEPVFNPKLETPRAAGDIRIDCTLDDAAWQSAARATGFVERFPGDNLEPQVLTEALVTYDDENFYVGFICHDDPDRIRATMSQRDQYGNDDEVVFCLDTYGEAAWAYEFCVNPYGVQKDMLGRDAREDPSIPPQSRHRSGYTGNRRAFRAFAFPIRTCRPGGSTSSGTIRASPTGSSPGRPTLMTSSAGRASGAP
jgi:hypothetical protein